MARGIIIFGSAGSGKTILGRLAAQKLEFPFFDLDDYIWRKDTPVPSTVMYFRQEKAGRLMEDISREDHFVMAGSIDSFNASFVPLFDLAIHLTAPFSLRLERIHNRELEVYGKRICEGGDMYENHLRFLSDSAKYDTDGSPCKTVHEAWGASFPCPVLSLDGSVDLEENASRIPLAYEQAIA